ncbi:MAG: FAD-dependent oxidoreductase, partial [Nitrospirota bacterium]
RTHEIILGSLDRSPLYSGTIKGIGPRYCPSIEDKVVRFADKDRHQIFLEPEGYDTSEYYANGISTSLPADVQLALVRTVEGLENAELMRPGYAIEYDFVPPTELLPNLMTKRVSGLFHAGQINGTSGYEEAAGQGLMAGINAAKYVRGEEPLILGRDEAYIGVMIDDLVTKGVDEPFRMFTSRAEYRLLLREDNADIRLMDKGSALGLISPETYQKLLRKRGQVEREIVRLENTRGEIDGEPMPLKDMLKRPEVAYARLLEKYPAEEAVEPSAAEQVEILVKYEGYIKRQAGEVERLKRYDEKLIPHGFDYSLPGLSREVREKLAKVGPRSVGQVGRIPGITPAAVAIILVALEKTRRQET